MSKLIFESLSASLICGVVTVVFALADASILAGTALPELFPVAVSITLISFAVLAAVVGVLSGMRFCIAGSQEVTIVILATMVLSVNSVMQAGNASGQERIATAIACILVATVFVACVCTVAGHYKLGRFIRYLPYPVIAGFLGGASILLIRYSVEMSTGLALQWVNLAVLLTPPFMFKLMLAVAVCAGLFALGRRMSSGTAIALLVVVCIPLFYLMVLLSGSPLQSWIQQGWTLIRTTEPNVFPVLTLNDMRIVDWGVVARHVPQMVSLALITLITALIKISTLESIARIEVDQDRELKALGAGNLAAGFAGGILGFHTLSITEISRRMNAPTRISGVGTAIVCLVALFFSGEFLTYLPRFAFAGIIMWISMDLLLTSFIRPCMQLPKLDTTILITVMLAIIFLGFLPAVVLGLVASTLIFVLEYSKLSIVKSDYSGESIRSNVDRGSVHSTYLNAMGFDLKVFRLQGYIFFGTAHRMLEEIRTALASQPVRYLILDFYKISGVDTSANLMFTRILSYCQSKNIILVIANAPDHTVAALRDADEKFDQEELHKDTKLLGRESHFKAFTNLDLALEWYESQQLAELGPGTAAQKPITLEYWLQNAAETCNGLSATDFFTVRNIDENEVLIQEGTSPDSLCLVLSGKFNVTVALKDVGKIRVRKVGPGSMLGEISVYTGNNATASVVAAEPSVVACIRKKDMQRMFKDHPQISAMFHQKIARELATRLADNSRQIQLLA